MTLKITLIPLAPSKSHLLGTDISGRDVFARLVYGFRIAILFSFALLFANYSIGITLGSFMGFMGGSSTLSCKE